MQQPTARSVPRSASVVSLDEARAARCRQRRSRSLARPLVALWFGVAIFATLLLLGFAATVALGAPAVGIPAGIAIATVASWSTAGTWLAQRRARPDAA